jgi:hypothetical protein
LHLALLWDDRTTPACFSQAFQQPTATLVKTGRFAEGGMTATHGFDNDKD